MIYIYTEDRRMNFGLREVKSQRFVGASEARLRAISAIEGDLFSEQEVLKAQVDPFGARKNRLDMMKEALKSSKIIFNGLKLFLSGNYDFVNLNDDIKKAKELLGAQGGIIGVGAQAAYMKKFPQLPDSVAIQKASELTKAFIQNKRIIIDVLKPLRIVNKADVRARATDKDVAGIEDLTLGEKLPIPDRRLGERVVGVDVGSGSQEEVK